MAWIVEHRGKDGRTRYQVHFRDAAGRHRSRSAGTDRELAETLRRAIDRAGPDSIAGPEPPSVVLDRYLSAFAVQARPQTVDKVARLLRPMAEHLDGRPLARWTPDDVRRWIERKRTTPGKGGRTWGPTSVRMFVEAARRWRAWCVEQRIPCADWLRGIRSPRLQRPLPEYLSPQEAARLLEAARGHPLEVRVGLALLAGLRRSEMEAAQVGDVQLGRRRIRVRPTKVARGRVVELDARLIEILKRRAPKSGPLAPIPYARPDREYAALHALTRESVGRRVSWHALRHTFATTMVAAGASLAAVRDLLGHSSLATTSIYLHAAEQDRRRAIDLLGDAIPPPPTGAP